MLSQTSGIAQMSKPSRFNLRVLQNWLRGDGDESSNFCGAEAARYSSANTRDLIALVDSDLDEGSFPRWLNPDLVDWYQDLFGSNKSSDPIDPESGNIVAYEESRFVRLSKLSLKFAMTVIGSLMPALTILILYHEDNTIDRIGTTIALTAVFGLVLAVFTNAKMKEIFASAAA